MIIVAEVIVPSELLPVDLEFAMNFRDSSFIVEEKMDGRRAILECGKVASVHGKRWEGNSLAQLTKADAIRIQTHPEINECVFDGELMKDGTFWIFDMLLISGVYIGDISLRSRKLHLATVAEFMPANFKIVRSFNSVAELGAFGEGVVIKDLSSKYGFGWHKAKRVETIDCIVTRILDSGVAETDGRGKIVGVPEIVKPGDCVEAEAFAVFPSGKLRNGKFVRTRDDK